MTVLELSTFQKKSKNLLINPQLQQIFFGIRDNDSVILSATTGSFSIAPFAPVIEAPGGKASASFSLVISIFTEIVKKVLKATRNKKEKHNKIVMLAISKLNSIESKISEALTNNEIRLERFNGIN